MMKKTTFLFGLLFVAVYVLFLTSFASAVVIIQAPVNGSNHTTSALFNVSYVNGTDIANPTNASFYYNLSGTWTLIGNTSSCAANSCSATLDTSGLTDGTYGINATIFNATTNVNVTVNIANYITFDNSAPSLAVANFTDPLVSGNYSGNFTINVSIVDNGVGIQTVYFNITNSTGVQNATYTASQEGSTNQYTFPINTSHFPEGNYNITVYVNDSLGNLNDSAVVTNVTFDNTNPSGSFSCTPSPVDEGDTVTCSCSGTDATSGVASATPAAVNPSTTSTGTIATTCTVTDSAGNVVVLETTYVVNGASVSGSSGGGGGGGTTTTTVSWITTAPSSGVDLSEGKKESKSLGARERAAIKVSGSTHHVGVVSLTDTSAVIQIASTPQEVTLNVGESEKFEITGDSIYDLLVTLNSISGTEADVSIEYIQEEIPSESDAGEDAGAEEAESGQEGTFAGGQEGVSDDSSGVNPGAAIFIVILGIVVGVIVAVVLYLKQHHKAEKS